MTLELVGREIWVREADGRSYVIARIPEGVTVDEWLRRYSPSDDQ